MNFLAKKDKIKFACTNCGNEHPKWQGKCGFCNEWNTIVEDTLTGKAAAAVSGVISASSGAKAKRFDEVSKEYYSSFSAGLGEFDRVLGQGIVKGGVTLISGEPGKGKSSILSQVSHYVAENTGPVLYSSGEESEGQGKKRFVERMKLDSDNIFLLHTKNIDDIEENVLELKPSLVIVDSIQMLGDANVKSNMGSVSQVSACTARLIHIAKSTGTAIFIVGQVLKDNTIAGPRTLEHMVDTVLYLEGEKYSDLRLLRSIKNRFGSANELGVFQMQEAGLIEIPNPSEYLLSTRQKGSSGSAIVAVSDTRPLLIEVQGLASPPVVQNATPRRTSEGFSRNRLNIIVAVLEKKCGIPLTYKDIYVNVVGGMHIEEPGADLGVAMALYSSDKNLSIDPQTLILGEIGLTGEVRPVAGIEQLVKEAEKVGFQSCMIPKKNFPRAKELVKKMSLIPVETVSEAVKTLFK